MSHRETPTIEPRLVDPVPEHDRALVDLYDLEDYRDRLAARLEQLREERDVARTRLTWAALERDVATELAPDDVLALRRAELVGPDVDAAELVEALAETQAAIDAGQRLEALLTGRIDALRAASA